MKQFQLIIVVVLAAFVLALGFSCGADDDDDDGGSSGNFTLLMTDAPVDDADAVNLTIDEVAIRRANSDGEWVTLDIETATYNLLDLQNNAMTPLAEQDVPADTYTELRFVLACDGDSGGEIVIDGESFPLKVPSGCVSGFKAKGEFTVGGDTETVVILDFDLRKSITLTGSDQYILKPVVRLVEEAAAGTISGEITPVVARTVVYAFEAGDFSGANFDDAINSTMPDNGAFTLAALPAGQYDLVVTAPGYETGVYVADLAVEAGADRPLDDPIELLPEE